jgi:choline dehydrogenase-like flavoprotein
MANDPLPYRYRYGCVAMKQRAIEPTEQATRRHPARSTATLRAMARVVCPPSVEDPQLSAAIVAETQGLLAALAPESQTVLSLTLVALEFGSLWPAHGGRRLSRLGDDRARRYVATWRRSRRVLVRQAIDSICGLLLLAFYEQPTVKVQLGFQPDEWIRNQARRRLEVWGDDIKRHEEALLVRAPLVAAAAGQGSAPGKTAGSIHGRDDFAGGTLECDVAIVGSGAGGAVMAAELAEAGLSVVVLEEGSHHPTETFTTAVPTALRALYRDGGSSAALGAPSVRFSEGRCVGGSTVINGGMSWRTPERILERWASTDGIDGFDARGAERYFERVERFISARPQDPDSIGRDQEIFRAGAERLGWQSVPNIRAQVHCAGCNSCILGCPTGAKQSTLVSYLPRAIRFGADVYADCRVERVLFRERRAVGVRGHVLAEDGRRGPAFQVRARSVVVAGGAIQTPALMVRSGVRTPSGQLGRNLALHPTAAVCGIFDEPVDGWKGVHQAYQVRQFQDDGLVLVAVNLPPSLLAYSLRHMGPDVADVMSAYSRIVTAGVLVEDRTRGRVRVAAGGRPIVSYGLSDDDASRLVRGVALVAELLFAAGARRVITPFDDPKELRTADDLRMLANGRIDKRWMDVSTVHVMGTAAMGADPRRHVCDPDGRPYGWQGLRVADASLFPSPIGVNPMETIMALATRSAERILDSAPGLAG